MIVMLHKHTHGIAVALVIALLLTIVAFLPAMVTATPVISVNADTFVDPNNPTNSYNNQRLELSYSSFSSFQGVRRIFVKIDLSGVSTDTSNSTLHLTIVENNLPDGVTVQVGLYQVLSDTWNESTNDSNAPAPSTLLDTVSVSSGQLSQIKFGDGTASHAVSTYIKSQQSGDGTASFLIRLDNGSGSLGFGTNIFFEDREGSADGVNGNEPYIDLNDSLAVNLASFTAISQPDHVLVDWQTVAELGNLGFNLLRSTSLEGEQVALNAELIPSQAPGSGQGASYSFEDDDVEDGTTYNYWLEDVDTSGTTTRHGPVSVTYDSNPTAVQVIGLGNGSRGKPWANGLLGTLLLAAGGYVWYRRRRA
jgi:hypothetical protein